MQKTGKFHVRKTNKQLRQGFNWNLVTSYRSVTR